MLLAIILTYPLITNFFTHIPGMDGDAYVYLYNQWWLKNALTSGLNFFNSSLLLYPFGANLSLSVTTISNNLIISFFSIFLPTIASFNLFIILSFTISAWGMFRLLQYLMKNKAASFFGGIIFSFHPYIFYELWAGHYNYSTVYFIPFFVLFLLKATRENTRKYLNASLAALFLLIGFYNDLYYTYGLIFVFILYFLWLWYQRRKGIIKDIKIFLLIVVIFASCAWPLGWWILRASTSGVYPFATIEQVSLYSPDIRSFFTPSFLNTFYGNSLQTYYQTIVPHNSLVYIGYLLILLTILGYCVNHREKAKFSLGFWRLLSIFFIFVSLGPILFVGGRSITPLPYQLLYFLPFLKGILVPSRLIIFFIFSLIIPASYGLKILIDKIKSRFFRITIIMGVIGLILFEYSSLPLPLLDTNIPEFYKKLAVEESNYTILELPFALSTSFYTLGDINSSSKLEYFQSVHHKPILGGYVSRVPNYVHNYYHQLTGLQSAISPSEPMNTKTISLEKAQVKKNFSDLKIGYIIIHPEYYVSLGYNKHKELVNTLAYFDEIFGGHYSEGNLLIYNIKSYITKP
ncbi:MAG: hypothetical protein WC458_03475 [Patescibacteria group bacterium]